MYVEVKTWKTCRRLCSVKKADRFAALGDEDEQLYLIKERDGEPEQERSLFEK